MHPKDRLFILSGGISGLGLATAKDLHSSGAYVALLDINADLGAQVVSELGAERSVFFEVDVRESSSIEKAVKGSMEWAGKKNIELGGVIAAAGVGLPAKMIDGRSGEPVSMEAIDFVLNINLRGTLDLIRQTLPHLIKTTPTQPDNERGVIIMVSSSAAFDGQPGQVAYSASKGAVAAMTLPMARDLARYGIRVVTIAPSLFESAMTAKLGEKARKSLERVMEFPIRAGRPEEFAMIVRQSIENGMLNGAVIRIDGAMRMPSKM